MGFKTTRKFDLSSYGWKGCYIEVEAITYKEMQDWNSQNLDKTDPAAAQKVFEYLSSKFVSGKALDEEANKVDLKKENLSELPFDIILGLSDWLFSGSIDQNLF